MKRLLAILVVMLFMLAAMCGCLLALNRQWPTLSTGASVPEDIQTQSYSFFPLEPAETNVYRLQLHRRADQPQVMLVLSAMRPFTLLVNGETMYTYTAESRYSRLHEIALPAQETAYDIAIQTSPSQRWLKALLTTPEASHGSVHVAQTVSCLMIGMHVSMLFCCMTLYMRKRSETYLLAQAAAVSITLISAALTAGLALPVSEGAYALIQQIIDGLRQPITFCAVLLLVPDSVPGMPLLRKNIVVLTLCYTLCTFAVELLRLGALRGILTNLTWVAVLVPLALAVCREESGMRLLSFVYLLRFSLWLYTSFTNKGMLPDTALLVYFYIPQIGSLILLMACMYLDNCRFAGKFIQADQLVVELEKANAVLDARVEERTAELTRQQQQRHSMMINIFHDLRSPLFAASGCADMMRAESEENRECLQVIREKLSFLTQLSEQLFLAAKLEDRQITFAQESVNLRALCRHLAASFGVEAEAQGVAFQFEESSVNHVTGDGFRLKQCLSNLLANALKFTQRGGSITLSLFEKDGYVCVSVRDTGKGIAPEEVAHVFERYYHGKNSDRQRSTGLGLSISNEIVLAHGGFINVESAPGEGTCFVVHLPAAEE